jgi:phosphoglycerol transferase MdoB-like AlkP superfamily enzyme
MYLLVLPNKLIGSIIDKILTFVILGITFFIVFFSFAGEFPFWDEFNVRYNFIAVDYLIYTYEVIENINQSYPIPVILMVLLFLIAICFWIFTKMRLFTIVFEANASILNRIKIVVPIAFITITLGYISNNKQAETSTNNYVNELSKNGVYAFFHAFRSNELDYDLFYKKISTDAAYKTIQAELYLKNTEPHFTSTSIERQIKSDTKATTPNIVLITIESFSADFLQEFGNNQNLTNNYEKLAKESIFFTNMYANGTRTVRGMEALTLCVPPTPGNSIVRRPNNENLFSIATVLKEKNYDLKFIYGGDGYFDNMNTFFGGQGFDIVDRNRGNPLSESITTKRFDINDNEVHFENAWGICDEDIYQQSIKHANIVFQKNKPFFQFIMTTSNHKPYSFPNKINMPQGSRESAVKYTDYALGRFIQQAKNQPWFSNTVFIIVADHCASSAGKWEINIEKYHIPAIIYNLGKVQKVNTLCSQIDLMPTVFSLLHWEYKSNFYGNNIFDFTKQNERALLGNYRTLGLLKDTIFTQLTDRKTAQQFYWSPRNKTMTETNMRYTNLEHIAISYYQTASERFKSGKMKNATH